MTNDIAMNIALVIGAIVFVYNFIFVFLKGTSKKQRFVENAKKQGNCVIGIEKNLKVYNGDSSSDNEDIASDTYEVTYEYEVNGKIYKKILCYNSRGVVGCDYPEQIRLYYDPKNPKKAVSEGEASVVDQKRRGCFTTIIVTCVTIKLIYEILKRLF